MASETELSDALSELKTAAENELKKWLEAWPPTEKLALVKLRKETGTAAAKYVKIAGEIGVTADVKITELAKCAGLKDAKDMVEEIIRVNNKEQLQDSLTISDPKSATALRSSTLSKTVAAETPLSKAKIAAVAAEPEPLKMTAAEPAKSAAAETPIAKEIIAAAAASGERVRIPVTDTLIALDDFTTAAGRRAAIDRERLIRPGGTEEVPGRILAIAKLTPEKANAEEPPPVSSSTPVGEFYADIADILTNLGEGIASAQKKLDIGAMMAQKAILEDETLSGYGLSANWYVMPEAEFNMRLEIGVTAEEKLEINQDGMLMVDSKTKVVAALNNSTYTSLYKVDNKQESSLKIRFVPMPMPDIVKVPDVTELHVMGARRTLAENMIKSLFIGSDGVVWKGTDGVVVAQSVQGGDIMLAEKTLILTVREMQEEEVAEGKINPEFSNIVRLEAVSAIRFDRALTSDLATKINASAVRLNTGDIVGAAKRTDLIKER
ncbi:MAG: hypothetical protein FWG19_00540 [Methanomassiliicoccaceae archaeon]|nr:hypothetical protein [Methanomassiliicoccaceae archaeon]